MKRKQLELNLDRGSHGGRRKGSGRKRIKSKGSAHRRRERVHSRVPLHISFKFRTYIKNKMALQLLKRAILHARKHGLRVHHYSMQTNHIHLIVEANDNKTLSTGMRSLTVTFGKGIRKGRIQIERYHLHVLKTLREAKNALRYVLLNEQKHSKGQTLKVDSYSTLTNLGYEFIKEWMRKEKLGLIWNPEEQVSSLEMKSSWLLLEAHNQLVL